MAATTEAAGWRESRQRRRWTWLCLLAAVVVGSFAAVLTTGAGGAATSGNVSNAGLCLAALSAAIACLLRAGSLAGRLRWGWALIGGGVLSWGLGQASWVYLETFRGSEVPFPSMADVGYLGMVLLTPIGLLILPSAAQTLANRARSVLDGLMVAASLVLMAWIFVVEPLINAGGDSVPALYVGLTYPLGDVVIVTIVIYMVALQRRDGRTFSQLALVGAGIVAFAASDIAYAYLNLVNAYASGGPTDVGWFAGFTLILLAARKPVAAAVAEAEAGDRAVPDGRAERAQPIGVLLPYVVVLGAVLASVVWFFRHEHSDGFVAYTRSALILLIVGRQLLTMLENRNLTRNLEARVADRTAALSASEQRFHALVQHGSDVVTVVSPESAVLYQSESVQRVFGYPASWLTGRRLTDLLDAESAAALSAALRAVARFPYSTTVLEINIRHRDRRVRQSEVRITNLLADGSVGGLVLNTRDISERKQLQDQLVHEAYHDTLTQLANRARFRERVGEALRGRRQTDDVSVLFLDLDGFKEVNDSLGHLAGDELLVQVADRLRASVRDGDLVARFGGDEFAVLIHCPVDTSDAEAVAQRIIDGLHEPFRIDDREIHVQASIGLASAGLACAELASTEPASTEPASTEPASTELASTEPASTEPGGLGADDTEPGGVAGAERLMRHADLAMYRAKSAGGGGFARYDPQMLAGLVERLELESDLRLALERGELRLHYQPTIDLKDYGVVGFEALIRWQHPTRGLIAPGDFIPIAEGTGLIVPLGRWVIAESCRQAVRWSREQGGEPVRMAVNVSVRQFDRSDLAAMVAEVLAETGMPAARLCLEMTESVLMAETDDNLAQLLRLKALGVTLAIDDFGTGYSSLAYLRKFPVDILKIDRSFVERLGEQTDHAALAATIVQLGRSLGMSTVAEGIEDYGQLAALREMGCDYAQGYYFSRPVSDTAAARLLSESAEARLTTAAA